MSAPKHAFTPASAFERLQQIVADLITNARVDHPLGVVSYTPAAFGAEYPALYLRDFTYMAESAPGFIPANQVRAIIDVMLAHLSPTGLCPERISQTGEVIYICHGSGPAADSALFLAKLCAAHQRQGAAPDFAAQVLPKLERTLATVPCEASSGLVWIDPAAPHTGYGFTDTIAITGRHLFCSLLRFEAFSALAALARSAGQPEAATRHAREAERIRAHRDLLWSPEHGLYLAGSQDCRQADVWGSAYACILGAPDAARRTAIARTLYTQRDRFVWRGQIRHLLLPEHWQRLIVDADWAQPGEFQNGPFWGTASGWVAETLELHQRGAGIDLLVALTADFAAHGVWECVGPNGYQRVPQNVSSACLPYASFERLLLRA